MKMAKVICFRLIDFHGETTMSVCRVDLGDMANSTEGFTTPTNA